MQTWVIANQKGGVGKTTTAIALAGELIKQGHQVLLIDADPQGSLSCYLGHEPETTEYSLYPLFNEAAIPKIDQLIDQIQETSHPNLQFIPASTSLSTLERRTILGGYGLVLKKYLSLLQKDYDFIVVDCAPSLGILLVNAIAACQKLIIPVQTEYLALRGLERMIRTVRMIVSAGTKQFDFRIIPTLFDRRTSAAHQTLDLLQKRYEKALWAGAIPVDTKLREAASSGILPSFFCPTSLGMQAYSQLTNDLKKIGVKTSQLQKV